MTGPEERRVNERLHYDRHEARVPQVYEAPQADRVGRRSRPRGRQRREALPLLVLLQQGNLVLRRPPRPE